MAASPGSERPPATSSTGTGVGQHALGLLLGRLQKHVELTYLLVLLVELALKHSYKGLVSSAFTIASSWLRPSSPVHGLGNGLVMDSPLPISEIGGEPPGVNLSAYSSGVDTELSGGLCNAIRHV